MRTFAILTVFCLAGAPPVRAQENRKPVIGSGPTSGPSPAFQGDSVTFTVQASDPDGGELAFSWNFGDGTPSTAYAASPAAGHRFAEPGRYAVTVRIRDSVSAVTGSLLVPIHLPSLPGKPVSSSSIVHDGVRNRVYAVNPDHGTFSAFDAAALVRLYERPCGADPRGVALAPDGTVWVSNRGSATVTVHDPADGTLLATLKLPYGSRPHGIAFRPAGASGSGASAAGEAFVALEGSGKLARLDPVRRALDGMTDLGPAPRALALTPDGSRILITRFISPKDHAEVYEVDATAFTRTRTWILDAETTPDSETSGSGVPNYLAAIAIAAHGKTAVVAAKKDNTARGRSLNGSDLTFENTVRSTLVRLDLEKNAESGEIRTDIDNAALPSALAFSPLGDQYFVALEGSDRFEVHDLFNHGAVLERNPQAGAAPMGLALDGDRGRLYLQNFLGRSVSVFDVRDVLSSARFLSVPLKEMPAVEKEALAPEVLAGKRIFYHAADSGMSRDGYLSCAVCHLDGGSDGRVWDFTDRGEGLRRTTSLLGRAGTGHGPVHWSANFDEIQDFEHDMRGPFGGRGFLSDAVFNQGTNNRTLGDPKAGLSRSLDDLAAYVSSLTKVNASPFRNSDGSFTADALDGKALFERADVGCAKCHSGSSFTDSRLPDPGGKLPEGPVDVFPGAASWRTAEGLLLHDVGTLKPSSGHRMGDTLKGIDTPTLKGIWETGPYLHDGSAADLTAVLTSANAGDRHGSTSHLSTAEIAKLAAYLRELDDGEAPATGLRDANGKAPMGGLRLAVATRGKGRIALILAGVTGVFPEVILADARGAEVRRFFKGDWRKGADGAWSAIWGGEDGAGRRVHAGVYLARVEADGRRTAARVPWMP